MSGPRFSGGDGLEPGSTERYVHDFMMLNELRAGEGAYAISSAGLAQSGLNGQRFVPGSDIDAMRSHLYKPTGDFGGDDAAV